VDIHDKEKNNRSTTSEASTDLPMTKRIDFNQKQKTSYCVETWLRDEQIRLAIKRPIERVQPVEKRRREQIAVVGFAPSLQQTWKQIKKFKYVITCSGAHKFLVDRGIVPNYHLEVDPREHKVKLIGQPQKKTEYLIASTCHPKVFDHLDGYNVKLWHVFDATEEGKRLLPHGEWAVTGGCDAGLRAMAMAAFLGFRNLHMFGMDGNAKAGSKHAAEHPNKVPEFNEVEYPEGSGKLWYTTGGMLEAAKQVGHEMNMLPLVKFTFHGKGLIQTMYKNYKPTHKAVDKPYANIIGFSKPELISEEYRQMNAKLHAENLAYGVGGGKHAKTVKKLSETLKTTSVLDYGCGKGYLGKALPFPIWEYDPAIPAKADTPRPADIVVCADVLEHIEADKLDFVLDDLRRVTKKVGYFVIHTGPSMKKLPDGRNAHLLQHPKAWWEEQLGKYFEIGRVMETGPLLYCVLGPKRTKLSVAKAA
jgi:uncharacterized Rossmann fold enzyme